LAFGPVAALEDLSGRGLNAEISDEDKTWNITIRTAFTPMPGLARAFEYRNKNMNLCAGV